MSILGPAQLRSEIGEETEIMDEHPPPLPSDPRDPKYRAALEAHIRAGSISESAGRAALDEIKKLPPLKSALEQRIEELELLLNSSIIENHAINVAAVLEGYRSGDLVWLDDQYYVFAEGQKVAGPRPMSGFDPQQVLWGKFPGPRSVWLEVDPAISYQHFARQSTPTKVKFPYEISLSVILDNESFFGNRRQGLVIPPRFLSDVSDPDPPFLTSSQYPIHVRLPSTGHTLPILFLDDSGSSSPTSTLSISKL